MKYKFLLVIMTYGFGDSRVEVSTETASEAYREIQETIMSSIFEPKINKIKIIIERLKNGDESGS